MNTRKSNKHTLRYNFRNFYPRLSQAIQEFQSRNYDSPDDFVKRADINLVNYGALLDHDAKGPMPGVDVITNILNLAFIRSREEYDKLQRALIGDMGWQAGKKESVRGNPWATVVQADVD